ncbi:MAG: hypothetical protein LBO04_03770 [Spirochaetaceae bacterium]|nr:hypothetical protein [Spirochaetaceae bacterium]
MRRHHEKGERVSAVAVCRAWALNLCKSGGALKEQYEYMTKVKGKRKKKAMVAIARKLGELMYTVLKNGTDYGTRHFRPKGLREDACIMAC